MAYLLRSGRVEEHGGKALSHVTVRAVVIRLLRVHSERVESVMDGWRGEVVESEDRGRGEDWIGERGGRDQGKQVCTCRRRTHCLVGRCYSMKVVGSVFLYLQTQIGRPPCAGGQTQGTAVWGNRTTPAPISIGFEVLPGTRCALTYCREHSTHRDARVCALKSLLRWLFQG